MGDCFDISVDGHWSSWSMWSACSVSCGKGETTRFRSCGSPSPSNGGLNCTGSNTEMQVCETVSCPGTLLLKIHV